jgi:hypothetical protein
MAEARTAATARQRPWYRVLTRGLPLTALVLGAIILVAEIISGGKLSETVGVIVGNTERATRASNLDVRRTEVNIDADAKARISCLDAALTRLSEGYKATYQKSVIAAQNAANISDKFAAETLQMMREQQAASGTIAIGGDLMAAFGMATQDKGLTNLGNNVAHTMRQRSMDTMTETMRQTIEEAKRNLTDWPAGLISPDDIDQVVAAARAPGCTPPAAPPPALSPGYDHSPKTQPRRG